MADAGGVKISEVSAIYWLRVLRHQNIGGFGDILGALTQHYVVSGDSRDINFEALKCWGFRQYFCGTTWDF